MLSENSGSLRLWSGKHRLQPGNEFEGLRGLKVRIGEILRTLSVALILWPLSAWSNTYTTNFPLLENPISAGGNWINGGITGLDWTNVQTSTGLAFGTMSGIDVGDAQYADSTAVLAGTWGPSQTAQATIAVNQASGDSGVFEEVELRLRTTITPGSITGYEINCSVSTNPSNYYIQIVRWNGPLGSWTELNGTEMHGVNGDVLTATISGSTITAYLNGAQVLQATDDTFSTGSPGIGFFLQGAIGLNANYGFSSFSATDGAGPTPTPAPTPTPTPAPTPISTPTPTWPHHHRGGYSIH
jgi:hypothetical protein